MSQFDKKLPDSLDYGESGSIFDCPKPFTMRATMNDTEVIVLTLVDCPETREALDKWLYWQSCR